MEAFVLNRTATREAFENELSKVVGQDELKAQLRALCLQDGPRKLPHFVFHGNHGTGKTTVGLMMGKLLHMTGILPCDKVTVLERRDFITDLDGTLLARPQAIQKIKEAEGGVLLLDDADQFLEHSSEEVEIVTDEEENFIEEGENFVEGEKFTEVETFTDEYLLAQAQAIINDSVDANEEIFSFMDSGNGVVIFAGLTTPKPWYETFDTRVSIVSHFEDDFSCEQLARILHHRIKYGNTPYKLDPWCQSVENIATLIAEETIPKQRKHSNGHLVNDILHHARESLACKIDPFLRRKVTIDLDFAYTITKQDLVAGVRESKWCF